MKHYEFTLVLDGVDDETVGLEDYLYDAGGDDALINFRNSTVFLDVTREAKSLNEAVLSTIKQLESVQIGAKVIINADE
ncbi:MAG: hypothetical protein K5Q00_01690 [Gammaproteobacteria bacterium]|nr:hypothetical protein [Gammaproteobacteria bacterium]